MNRNRLWRWPNILGVDAAVIAVCWQTYLEGSYFRLSTATTLGLCVWLTYMADRLFDVRSRSEKDLLSLRHRFTKKYYQKIWIIWWSILLITIIHAFSFLDTLQIRNGSILLLACLAYTLMNQLLAKYFFPKEICVAILFTCGILIFTEKLISWQLASAMICLYFLNCLLIGYKERQIDKLLKIHSLSSVPLLLELTMIVTLIIGIYTGITILVTFIFLLMLYVVKTKINAEDFRVAADAILLLGPLLYWLSM